MKALAGCCAAKYYGKECIFLFFEGGEVVRFDVELNCHINMAKLPYAISAPKNIGQVHGAVKLASLIQSLGIIK